MGANFRRIMSEVPRPMHVMEQDSRTEPPPIGYEPPDPQRLAPLLGLVASGQVPLDEDMARHIANYVEHSKHG